MKIGWAEETFHFSKPISLAGQFAERISEYTEKPLTTTALAIECGQEQMVICSVDLVNVSCVLVDRVRDELRSNSLGLEPEKVIICAIHTHTGPTYAGRGRSRATNGVRSFRALIESELPPDKKYTETECVSHNGEIMQEEETAQILVSGMVKAVLRAWEERKEGGFYNTFGRAAVGMCRRVVYSDGSAQMWGDTNRAVFQELEGGNDSGIELLYVFDRQEKLTGVVANLACPAQCVQHRHFISPDFWGETKRILREYFGEEIFLLPLCSAAGDQCPVDLVRFVEPESDVNDPNITRMHPLKRKADPSMFDLTGMKKVGKRVADEIIAVYREERKNEEILWEAGLIHEIYHMQLPVRRATLTEEKEARKAIREYLRDKPGNVDFNDAANLHMHLGILRRMELQEKANVLDTEVHILRLGNIAIATNPFELFLDYGNQLKARSRAEQTFLIQLANGAEGYLPTLKAEKGGHYSGFIASGYVGHEGGEMLVRETLQAINRLWE